LLPDGNAIDLARMADDLAHAIPTIPSYAVSHALLSFAHSNDPLRVSIPSEIVDAAGDDVVFALGCAFANTVPDTHAASDIGGGDVEARG
jgi:hypothetical protein